MLIKSVRNHKSIANAYKSVDRLTIDPHRSFQKTINTYKNLRSTYDRLTIDPHRSFFFLGGHGFFQCLVVFNHVLDAQRLALHSTKNGLDSLGLFGIIRHFCWKLDSQILCRIRSVCQPVSVGSRSVCFCVRRRLPATTPICSRTNEKTYILARPAFAIECGPPARYMSPTNVRSARPAFASGPCMRAPCWPALTALRRALAMRSNS